MTKPIQFFGFTPEQKEKALRDLNAFKAQFTSTVDVTQDAFTSHDTIKTRATTLLRKTEQLITEINNRKILHK